MIMALDFPRQPERRARPLTGDASEPAQPRSLALALHRMDFPRPAGHQATPPPRTWHRQGDDPAPDWQPL